jgi:catechol 2,3-dioxygenase-like lactoylglutathione lyase family enzyme
MAFVSTTDLDRAHAFYAETLGLEPVDRTPFAAVFLVGATPLRVTRAHEVVAAPYTVLGWVVTDIADEMRMLAGRGLTFQHYEGLTDETGVWTTPGGDKIAWFKDPDGNVLSLTQFA